MSVSLENRFRNIFHCVEGTREPDIYAHSDHLPQELRLGVTPVNPWHRRILSELDFCLQLKAYGGVNVTAPVDAALSVLEQGFANDGVLTDSICRQAEEALLPLAEEAKTYTLLMVGHAHLDMNWMWSWDETVATVVATFKTMLKLMEEYPDFCFSQSQASTYKIIEDHAPELMPKIKARIAEGRWEVTAAAWVETDKNMPCTDSILNHILYTKQYLQEHWGIDPASLDLDFSPDTFGHSAFLPELDTLGGIKYYYHCRGNGETDTVLYRWQAPSGKELLIYREPYWYNSGITPNPGIGLPRIASLSGGLRTGMAVYGVGDHGGGPTRRDLNRGIEMQAWPVFPVLRFGTLHDYFAAAEAVRDQLPVVDHELNHIFTGCYTTQSRIKRGNRRSESSLIAAEGLCALASRELGIPYADRAFETAWQNTLFTHFHDIITGSCKQDSREYAMGLYQEALTTAQTRSAMALEALASQIDTSSITVEEESLYMHSEGAGVGFGLMQGNIPTHENGSGLTRIFHLFNTTGTDRHENAAITVWDWPGNLRLLEITDIHGNPLPFEADSELKTYWTHRYFTARVTVDVPANGYTTVVLREKDPEEMTVMRRFVYANDRLHHPFEDIVLENRYLKATFDRRSGELFSLVDKVTGAERIRPGQTGGLRYIRTQRNDMSSWVIDRYLDVQKVTDLIRVTPLESALNPGLQTEHKLLNSRITSTVTLGSEDRFLRVQLNIDWHEQAATGEDQPVLSWCLPLAQSTGRLLCDVPGGVQWRAQKEMDVPCLRYGAAECADGRVLALVSDCKYGFRLSGEDLFVTLINTGYNPDPYPERGIHDVTLFLLADEASGAALARQTDICLNPLQYITGSVHSGSWADTGSFLQAQGESAVFCSISRKNGKLTLRAYEAEGKVCPVTVTVRGDVKAAVLTDLFGSPTGQPVETIGSTVRFTLQPYTTVQLQIG